MLFYFMERFRILAASDLHGDSFQASYLANKAVRENADLVVLCGDLTNPLQTKGLIKPFLDHKKRVLLVPGNHDGLFVGDFLSELYGVKNLHNGFVSYGGIGFFGCGVANVGIDALSDVEAFDILKNGFNAVNQCHKKIMVTHVHPHGTIVDKMVPGLGSLGVRKAIDILQPDLLLCGHMHEAEGVEDSIGKTKIHNVGRNGKIIDV